MDEETRTLIKMSKKIEGMPRHASTHAAGVVIADRAVSEYVPLALNDESIVTQFTMTELEELKQHVFFRMINVTQELRDQLINIGVGIYGVVPCSILKR